MRMQKTAVGIAAFACGLAGAAVAFGSGPSAKSGTTGATTTTKAGHTPEVALTGDIAAQAKAAAVAKVGGTADRATTENDSSNPAAVYEVHVTKTDGTHVKVILDSSFAVLGVETGGGPRGHRDGHGPGHGGSDETALTGAIATQAKAAAVAKVGGTADRATTENDNSSPAATYEVHVTKTDGTHVKVILDSSFTVLSVETGGGPHGPGNGSHHDDFRR